MSEPARGVVNRIRSFRVSAIRLGCLCLVAVLAGDEPLLAVPPQHAQWEMTFCDEFAGDRLDFKVWESQAGPRSPDDIESRWPENNVVRDGVLYQVTRRESVPRGGKDWTTAHIWTRTFQQQFGYFEARMRYGKYLNNAFWLFRPMGQRFAEPPHFEIDINEGHTPRDVCMTFHHYFFVEGTKDLSQNHHSHVQRPSETELPTGSRTGPIASQVSNAVRPTIGRPVFPGNGPDSHDIPFLTPNKQRDRWSTHKTWQAPVDLEADYHLYGVEWDQDQMIWYVDDKPVRRVANRWAQAPADVRLSTVIMPRQLAKDGKPLEVMDGVSMATDWVRVYRKIRDLSTPQDLPPLEPGDMPRPVKRDPQVCDGTRKTVLWQEDFQTAADSGLPSGWQIGDGHPALETQRAVKGEPPPPAHNRVLRLNPGDYVFRMFQPPVSGRLEVEFDFFCPLGKNGLLLSTLGKFDPANQRLRPAWYYAGDIGAYIQWTSRTINYFTQQENWTGLAEYRGGKWTHARVLIDVSKRALDVYGGNPPTQFLGSGPFRGKQKAACGIALRHHGTSDAVFVDNVVLRSVED